MAPVQWTGQWVGAAWTAEPTDGDIGAPVLKDGREFVRRLWVEGEVWRLVILRPTNPRRAEPPVPDLAVRRGQIKRMGKVRMHVVF